jgi:CHAD domain-containing protein
MRTTALRDGDRTAPPVVLDGAVRPSQLASECLSCFRRIASSCLQAIESNHRLVIAGNSEAIHRMRIELTRLRAAVLFFAPVIDDAAWPGINHQLRWLNSTLGSARNRDVAVEYTDRKHYRRCTAHSRRTLLQFQDKAHRYLARKLGSTRYGKLTSELHHWISNRPSCHHNQAHGFDQLDAYCEEYLREWRNEVGKGGLHVRTLRRKPLHQLRIRSKHYRYIVEALLDQGIPVSREDFLFCETARRVHRALGELRDLRLLRKVIGRRPPRYRERKRELIRQVEDLFHPAR